MIGASVANRYLSSIYLATAFMKGSFPEITLRCPFSSRTAHLEAAFDLLFLVVHPLLPHLCRPSSTCIIPWISLTDFLFSCCLAVLRRLVKCSLLLARATGQSSLSLSVHCLMPSRALSRVISCGWDKLFCLHAFCRLLSLTFIPLK